MIKKKKKKWKIRKEVKKLFVGMIAVVAVLVVSDNARRDMLEINNEDIIDVEGDFISKTNPPNPPETIPVSEKAQPTTMNDDSRFMGFRQTSINADELSQGYLVIADDSNPVSIGRNTTMVRLSDYRNEYYTVNGDGIMLNEEVAEALNLMMVDYKAETNLCDFVIYGTTDTYTGVGSYCPRYFPESKSGNTIDVALIAYGAYLAYDGMDEEKWLIDNCAKYGFVLSAPERKGNESDFCPWHLRYVGKLNASIMSAKNMTIEEYVDFLKKYDVDSPYTHKMNGSTYVIYTVKSEGETTSARVPANGNYELSGDNKDTYIVNFKR